MRQVEIKNTRADWLFGWLEGDQPVTFQEGVYTDMSWDSGIGNRWQWQSFTLGCEWFGFYTRGAKLSHKLENDEDPTADAEKRRQIREDDPGLGNFRFLTLHAGVVF